MRHAKPLSCAALWGLLAFVAFLAFVASNAAHAAVPPRTDGAAATQASARPVAPPAVGAPAARAPSPLAASTARSWLPPGASPDDGGPSAVIFPPQSVPLHFSHQKHLALPLQGRCLHCHGEASHSRVSGDRLLPDPRTCDGCHGSSHADRGAVRPGPAREKADGRCATCHAGYTESAGNRVAAVRMPTANLRMNHQAHLARNIGCEQCHGDVSQLDRAGRDQLPRMPGCLTCHQGARAASAAQPASGQCETCHLTERARAQRHPDQARAGGRDVLATHFAHGTLQPGKVLRDIAHTGDFVRNHQAAAVNHSAQCKSCHQEPFCADCHDGRVRPRAVHPGDYLRLHALEASQQTQKCTSCHREQSFCLPCHQRLGVSQSGPLSGGVSGRFHPPRAVFTDGPRTAQHHGSEAMRNLNACVSCHIERDCVACHGGRGLGGGFSPHPAGFEAQCDRAFARNMRPCLTCHELGSREIARCR